MSPPSVPAWLSDGPVVYVHPGQVFVSAEPLTVTTVLGSCIAVCLWDRLRHVGGMNHYLLPDQVRDERASARFGSHAMRALLSSIQGLGASRAELTAKVFGGMCALKTNTFDLGRRNYELARRFLHEQDIPIVAEDVGGDRGRRVVFRIQDGSVWVRKF